MFQLECKSNVKKPSERQKIIAWVVQLKGNLWNLKDYVFLFKNSDIIQLREAPSHSNNVIYYLESPLFDTKKRVKK